MPPKKDGIVTAVAIVHLKLVFFFIGIYVTYFVFDGFGDIYTKASVLENFHKNTIGGLSESINWFSLCVIYVCHFSITKTISSNHRK
jgi:hypothetical protein